ncbi:MAG: DUF2141 domain-containing protein [Bacteroidia bacterium]|nr:DUF2141 domain-containing protein [Bacteroidia bacterium]
MKKLALVLLLCVFIVNSGWKSYQNGNLKVVVKGVKSTKGSILVALTLNKDTFLKKFDYGLKLKSAKGEVEAVFENLPPGIYAISVIHDENDNGTLDTNALGMPKEGFGFGNNAMGKFGPPPFKEATITWAGSGDSQVVELRYL